MTTFAPVPAAAYAAAIRDSARLRVEPAPAARKKRAERDPRSGDTPPDHRGQHVDLKA